MTHEWIYRTTGLLGTDHEEGPVAEPEMLELAEEGKLALNTLVSSPTCTLGRWYLLSQIPILAKASEDGVRRRNEQKQVAQKQREQDSRLAEQAKEKERLLEEMMQSVPPSPLPPVKAASDSSADVGCTSRETNREVSLAMCPGCSRDFDDTAAACPHCGFSAQDKMVPNYSTHAMSGNQPAALSQDKTVAQSVSGILMLVGMAAIFLCCGGGPLMLLQGSRSSRDSLNSNVSIKARQDRAYNKFQSGERLSDGDVANLAGDPIAVSPPGKETIQLFQFLFGIGVLMAIAAIGLAIRETIARGAPTRR